MSAPATRAARHSVIEQILARDLVRSQSELRAALADHGIDVTQATVSRDLDELRAVKVRGADGDLAYALPALVQVAGAQAETVVAARLARWCAECLLSADHVRNQVVLRTPPGAAQLLASALDQSLLPEVLGCIAGDDTVLVVTRTDEAAADLTVMLLDLARRGGPDLTTRTRVVGAEDNGPHAARRKGS